MAEAITLTATMTSGEQRTVSMDEDATLHQLRNSVADAFSFPIEGLKLFNSGGELLVTGMLDGPLATAGIKDGDEITIVRTQIDIFDGSRCEDGNIISESGRTLRKIGGSDLTSTFGARVVESGAQHWHLRVDELRTNNHSNIMIGVAHPDLPLDHIQKVWSGIDKADKYDGKLFYVKSPGNTTKAGDGSYGHWEVKDFGSKDIISVEVDLDLGLVSFTKNGVAMGEPKSNVVGPLSLWINLDYDNDQLTILDS
jgi:hypothetical protein